MREDLRELIEKTYSKFVIVGERPIDGKFDCYYSAIGCDDNAVRSAADVVINILKLEEGSFK